ncbi:MAG: GAF domain-containing protein [Nitrospirota bacterium]
MEELINAYEEEIQDLKDKLEKYESLESNLLHFAEEPDPARLIDIVAKTAARMIRADTVAVPMLSPDNLEIHYGHVYGRNKEKFLSIRLPIEKSGLCGWVLENRKSILCENLIDDPRVSRDLAKELNYTTAALVPLIARGRIMGGLSAFRDGPPFTDEDKAALARLANYAAVVIDNAHLMQELSKERKKLNTIFDEVEDGIILLSHEGVVLKANKSVEKYLPLKSHELLGASVQEFINLPPLDEVFGWNVAAPPGKRCWEVKKCNGLTCPMYKKDYVRCWANSGGYCCQDGSFTGKYSAKLQGQCSKCEVIESAAEVFARPRVIKIMGRPLIAVSSIIKPESQDEMFGEILVLSKGRDED